MPLKKFVRNGLTSVLVFLQVAAFPSFAIAQEAAPETNSAPTSSATAPAEEPQRGASNTGPTSPTGADANKYTKNEDGTWSNGTYTWDPNTKQTSPNKPQDYSYNPTTGHWDTADHVYDATSGKYVPNVKTPAPTTPAPTAARAATNPSGASIDTTGPGSTNTIGGTNNTNGTFDLFFNGAISNTVNSNATSGDALVQGNTSAGSALTGDATAIANLINMLQSSWLGSEAEIATFVNNIDGNVYGDLLIDPSQLPYASGTSNNTNIDVNVANNGTINNDIDLVAQSGNATVDSNTKGGDAATGNATAMANVINMINSAINANQSFMGMININGSLNGDILLPQGVLDALISNTGTNSTNTIGGSNNTNLTANTTTNRDINNNVNASANSGDALVDSNTKAGNGTTGAANTSTNTMNLVGQNISGKNGLLVFVNVMGKWVGMVVGPSQTTASISNTGSDSTNQVGPSNNNQSITVNATENSQINNDISVSAGSGDATVSNNTEAGNATSGNANASVNLLNMIGSTVNVSDWFGVLFINVFGNWFGDFGNDTANGGYSQSPQVSQSEQTTSAPQSNVVGQVFGFVARTTGLGGGNNDNTNVQARVASDQTSAAQEAQGSDNTAVLGSSSDSNPSNGQGAGGTTNVTASGPNWWLIAGIVGLITSIIVLIREYIVAVRAEKLANL